MKRCISAVLALLLLLALPGASLGDNASLPAPEFKEVSVHDPSVIRAPDGTFYIFGSHMAAARSTDLIQWKMISRNAETGCKLFENVQQELSEALRYAKTTTFWAPDVQQLADGRYYFYYCACEGSSPLSALGVAVSDAPEGPYRDLGIFLRSGEPGYDATVWPNVVDPCVFFDKDGRLWMVYGSYSGGIFILEMDPSTGFPLEGQGYGKKLLGKNHARIEGPYILYSPETDYYYLFLSFGGLNAADGYNVRVCRSRNPDGPYEDALGQQMIDCGGKDGTYFNDPDYEPYGVKLLGGWCFENLEGDTCRREPVYRSPGHNSAFYEPETGRYFLLFHSRFVGRGENHQVRVHQMMMNADGWPVVLPWRYAGEMPEPVSAESVPGVWKVLLHERDINCTEHRSVASTFRADGTVGGALEGTWSCEDGRTFTCTLGGTKYHGVMNLAWDNQENAWVPCFSALDESGAALWGTRAAHQ